MANFKRITCDTQSSDLALKNAVIMGRKTWESIPAMHRPLPDRVNVILSSNSNLHAEQGIPSSTLVFPSLETAVTEMSSDPCVSRIFIIGGEAVYKAALTSGLCSHVYMTAVDGHFPDADTFFPVLPATEFALAMRSPVVSEKGISYRFTEFKRIEEDLIITPPPAPVSGNAEEQQYLDAIARILKDGVVRSDRTGTGTKSLFGMQMRFSLRNNVFPLLTTKRVFWRGVAEELLWFVKGSTNANELAAKDIHIWDGNGSREFLDKRGLTRCTDFSGAISERSTPALNKTTRV